MMKLSNMYILHIETSTAICSVALSDHARIIEVVDLVEGMNHTALLIPAIEQLLKRAGITPKELNAVSVSAGPGSYTGLRVGSSTAKAMAYALHIPLIPVPTLLALASAAKEIHQDADYMVPMLDARRNEVYTAVYDKNLREVLGPSALLVEPGALEEILLPGVSVICGNGSQKVEHIPGKTIIESTVVCSAVHLVKPAIDLLENHLTGDPMRFVPFYLKPPNITQSKKIF